MSDWSKEVILTNQDEINLAQKSFDSRIRGKPKSDRLQTTAHPRTSSFERDTRASVDKKGVKAQT